MSQVTRHRSRCVYRRLFANLVSSDKNLCLDIEHKSEPPVPVLQVLHPSDIDITDI